MNTYRAPLLPTLLCGLGLVILASTASAQWVTQTIPLQQGWNAVHVRVQPRPAACDEVFTNLPVQKVFRYNARMLATEFGTDPTQPWKRPDEWLVWVPTWDPSSDARTLENLLGSTAYLIQTTNPCTLTLRGPPAIPRFNWVPDQPNLVGFQISPYPEWQPSFADFFRYEPAIDGERHFDRTNIAQIGPNLEITNLTSQTPQRKIDPGLAYWIRAQAASDYIGPLRVSTTDPEGLHYGTALNELELRIINACNTNPSPITVTIRHVASESPPAGAPPLAGAMPLLYADRTATNWIWRAWPVDQSQNWSLTNGQLLSLRLAVNRAAMSPPAQTNALCQSILQVSASTNGTFIQVPLSAAYDSGTDQIAAFPFGLWVGEAYLNAASYVQFDTNLQAEAASPEPLPTGGTVPLRLILHAGSDGNCRLLSSAVLAALPDANSNIVNRIYTDAANVPTAATTVARVSSAALGRIPPVGLDGGGFLNELHGTYTVGYNDPLNPFKHVYHPSHDNLDADENLLPEGEESFTVSNRVTLTWNTLPDPTLGATLWRPDEITTGIYEHEIGNLRHTNITLRGAFTLKRVSRVGTAQ
jgi:hypothetical protein